MFSFFLDQIMSSVKTVSERSTKNSRRKTSGAMSADASPDSKCPICLDIFSNISYLDICLHKFCFKCIREWAKNKAECPLCKQPFNSIYHSVKTEQDFQKYDLLPSNNGSFGSFGGVRFRYRTTLTGVHRQRQERTSVQQHTGVVFEAPTTTTTTTTSAQQDHDRYLRQMMMRLAARKKAAREGREATKIREQEMINFRRDLYRWGVRVRTVQDGGRSRDISAKFYQRNPACLHRLVPWLKRELLVLYGPIGGLVNMVQHIIMSKITCFDMESEVFQEELRPFLQGRTDHFLHEFICFAKSPFNMETHDHHAVYDCPAGPSEENSSSNSSVIAISEDEEHSEELDQPRESTSTLGHSVSDGETPGPSYATSEVSRAGHRILFELDSDSSFEGEEEETKEFKKSPQHMEQQNQGGVSQGGANSQECLSSDSECVIVGFVKPRSERTPELIQLSSNSDSDSEDNTAVPPTPSMLSLSLHLSSSSPTASHASTPSGTERSRVEKYHYQQLNSKESSSRYKTPDRSDRKDRDRRQDGSKSLRKRHKSKDREHRRRRSCSRERRHSSRSPVTSQSSVTRQRSHSYYRGRDLPSDIDRYHRSRESYRSYHSYRHYSHDGGKDYTEKQSYSYSSGRYLDRHSSNSCSRSHSRDSQKHKRRYSCSPSHSRSPSTKGRFYHDKPGGKRKYKSRHLDSPSKCTPSDSCPNMDSSRSTKHKKKSKEKHRKKSKDRSRKSSRSRSDEEQHVDKECSAEQSKRHHKKKKKHKKKSKKHRRNDKCEEERSLTVITIDSDSDSWTNVCVNQVSSTTNRYNCVDDTSVDPEEPGPLTPGS